jgi:hypothetical protein
MEAAGFKDLMIGFQPTSQSARQGPFRFGPENEGVFRSWFIASGIA